MHGTIQRFTLPVGVAPATRTSGVTGLVYRGIRAGVDRVGSGLEAALDPWTGLAGLQGEPSTQRDALLAAVNGIWGDHLRATDNPLALSTSLRPGDFVATAPRGLLVLAHGLCMADTGWRTKNGHDHGVRLAEELNLQPLYLQYNSGLPIHQNGQSFAALLEAICQRWSSPVEEIILLGYSMGGLVCRSACHYAQREGYTWTSKLTKLVTLGTPHHGSPLQRAGAWADFVLEISPYSEPIARLTRRRSAGIAALGHGAVTEDEDVFVQLPADVQCYAIAGSRSPKPPPARSSPGDGLVPVDSALGRHPDAERTLAFPDAHQAVLYNVTHLGLLASEDAFVQMRAWMRA